ncbi:MAG TPA: type II toxin-antitoxin system ParD family antitoxin [Rhodanobacteraceae bacterium]|nr:type II toxin-antitoxin system ParD family antitoxin [Rhodanobacteraceae bacterium]
MPTRNVVLTDQQSSLVDKLVTSGRYQNASEVLRDGLRLVEQRERGYATRLESLREAVTAGVADMDAGRYETFDDPAKLEAWVMALDKDD